MPEVDRFLRELDKVIGALSPSEREAAIDSIRQLARAAPGISFVRGISKMAWAAMLGSVVIALSGERTMDEWVTKTRARAETIGEHVGSLFRAL